MNIWKQSPDDLLNEMHNANLRRAYIIRDPNSGALKASHPLFAPIAAALSEDQRDYKDHQGMFFEIGAESGHLLGAFIHKTIRGQAAGGLRFWSYASIENYVRDGLRLARGMGHKNALAGLWWGGGKGVIARRQGQDFRDPELGQKIYQDYGRFISSLRGCYVTAEDVGTTPPDMAQVFMTTRHTTCIPESAGGSGNPSKLTARGVVVAMEAALDYLKIGDIAGKTVAMQGAGNVARFMVSELLERKVAKIIVADIDEQAIAAMRQQFSKVPLELRQVEAGDMSILAESCDILAPNAVGATLNSTTIPSIQAKLVCGAANNQLEDPTRDDLALKERNILYVPDFLANRMGIVNCANEQYGVIDDDPAIFAQLSPDSDFGIFQRAQQVFARAQKSGQGTGAEAVSLADELSLQSHPIWGNRGQQIIDALVKEGWASAPRE